MVNMECNFITTRRRRCRVVAVTTGANSRKGNVLVQTSKKNLENLEYCTLIQWVLSGVKPFKGVGKGSASFSM